MVIAVVEAGEEKPKKRLMEEDSQKDKGTLWLYRNVRFKSNKQDP